MKPHASASLRFSPRFVDAFHGVEPLVRVGQLAFLLWLSVTGAGLLAHAITDAGRMLLGMIS